jgi:hypothetical protein
MRIPNAGLTAVELGRRFRYNARPVASVNTEKT